MSYPLARTGSRRAGKAAAGQAVLARATPGKTGKFPVRLPVLCRRQQAGTILRALALTALLLSGSAWVCRATAETPPLRVESPYRDVDWEKHQPRRANLHAHTTESDGRSEPAAVIAEYRRHGFDILAITDHDRVTWPWEDYGAVPKEHLMLAVPGNEVSRPHHMGAYFCRYEGRSPDEHETLRAIGALGGLAVFFHPGYYGKPAEWYLPFFRDYPHLLGMEVFNAGNRYPGDRALWDELLAELMPGRPVWGFSNDDMHYLFQVGFNCNTLLLEELDADHARRALEKGAFFFSRAFTVGRPVPLIRSIVLDAEKGTVTIEADHCERINWVSDGRVIFSGQTFSWPSAEGLGNYFRAELKGPGGETLTNPFGVIR